MFLPSTKRLQLPDWEEALPPEARGNVGSRPGHRRHGAPAACSSQARPRLRSAATGDGD